MPDTSDIEALFNQARAHGEKGRWEDAAETYQRAAELDPGNIPVLYNLGNAYFRLGRWAGARQSYERLLAFDPGYIQGWINLGLTAMREGETKASIEALRKAVGLEGSNILAHLNLGLALLLDGQLEEGFAESEWRRHLLKLPFPDDGRPAWDGNDPGGKRILAYTEQGYGDAIHFLRYAGALARSGARVSIYCYPPLVRLAAAIEGVEQAAGFGDPAPDFDAFAPLMSLPHLMGAADIANVPPAPYLKPPPPSPLVRGGGTARVGLVWSGSAARDENLSRSCALAALKPLLEVPGTTFYSLQMGAAAAEIEAEGLSGRIADLGDSLGDFYDTAALIQALDLLISVDTAFPHLAGAMGKPAWLVLSRVPDWRWFLEGSDTPWYPTVRLFRQAGEEDWAPVIERVRDELVRFTGNI